jgi:phospholipid/cholesterol/gamma-HCH transport system permease protein
LPAGQGQGIALLNQRLFPKFTEHGDGREPTLRLSGQWTALALAIDHRHERTVSRLGALARAGGVHGWDLRDVERLDHVGAQALWRMWGHVFPARLELNAHQREIFMRVAVLDASHDAPEPVERVDPVTRLGLDIFAFGRELADGLALFGSFVLDLLRVLARPTHAPWTEFSAHVYSAGARALPITALVAFLIGIVLSYLSAQQLKAFGASVYVVNLLGLSVVRELGPVLSAILIAGRSGSAITAQLGVMRVTEELDAMRVMGIPHGMRLVLPRVLALGLAMPLLVMWTDIVALAGGMVGAHVSLGVDYEYFIRALRVVVPIANLWIGLGKGIVFGMLIALVACHFGLRIEANSQSLGAGTTRSVVTSITAVIIADAVFAVLFQRVGISFVQ